VNCVLSSSLSFTGHMWLIRGWDRERRTGFVFPLGLLGIPTDFRGSHPSDPTDQWDPGDGQMETPLFSLFDSSLSPPILSFSCSLPVSLSPSDMCLFLSREDTRAPAVEWLEICWFWQWLCLFFFFCWWLWSIRSDWERVRVPNGLRIHLFSGMRVSVSLCLCAGEADTDFTAIMHLPGQGCDLMMFWCLDRTVTMETAHQNPLFICFM